MLHPFANILRYYESTRWDYQQFWQGTRARALHFGYWGTGAKNHEESLLAMNAEMARRVHIQATDRVLDAGCGVGGSSIWLAKNVGCSAVGITIVPHQVEQAQHYAQQAGVEARAQFLNADYQNTGLPDHSFDVVWFLESLVHAEDKAAVLREAHRLLRPGGRLIINEYMLKTPYVKNASKMLDTFLEGWAMPHLKTPQEYLAMLQDIGFRDMTCEDESRAVAPSLKSLWNISMLMRPGAWFLYQLGIFSRARYHNVVASIAQYQTFKAGLWNYHIITAKV